MLTISPIKDAGHAAQYFEGQTQQDRRVDPATGAIKYFAESGEPPGRWRGPAVAGHAENDIMKAGELQKLLEGEGFFQKNGHTHRPGWDLTFSMPKSAAAVWAIAPPELKAEIEKIHTEAVAAAKKYLDDTAVFTRRGKNGVEKEPVQLLAVEYQHAASREDDPHLHSHLIVFNACVREDGTTGTIETRPIYAAQKTAGALYHADMAAKLKNLGFDITEGEGKTFDVAGVPEAAIESWSKRHEQIAQNLKKMGASKSQGAAAEVAWAQNRADKHHVNRGHLFEKWEAEGRERGFTPEKLAEIQHDGPGETYAKPLDWEAIRHDLTQHDSTFAPSDLILRIAQDSLGRLNPEEIRQQADEALGLGEKGGFVFIGHNEFHQPIYTTAEHFAQEKQMVTQMIGMAAKTDYAADPTAAIATQKQELEAGGHALSTEQERAIRTLTGGQQIATLYGMAGAGKTTTLNPVVAAYREAGYELYGMAPSNQAAKVLHQDTGVTSVSTAKFLTMFSDENMAKKIAWDEREQARAQHGYAPRPWPGEKDLPKLGPKTVLILDESGMIDTPQMARITDLAARTGAKIIMAGDDRQLQAIGAGGGFAAARKIAPDAMLTEIHRQHAAWQAGATKQMADLKAREALMSYAQEGKVQTGTLTKMTDKMVGDWMADRVAHPDDSRLIIASTNAQGALNNRLCRRELERAGEVGPILAELKTVKHGVVGVGVGDEIMFRKNDRNLGVINSDKAQVLSVEEKGGRHLITAQKGNQVIQFAHEEYDDWHLGYSSTAHKSQGSTVDRAFYLVLNADRASLGYVAASRHRKDLQIYIPGDLIGGIDKKAKHDAQLQTAIDAAGFRMSQSDHKKLAWQIQRDLAEVQQERGKTR